MKLHVIDTGFFKLDGGAMFGVVPKQLWNKTNPADELNLCTWAMRCLLVEDGKRLTLIDTGIGNKQNARFFSHYHLQDTLTLDHSLAQKGFHRNDITDVLLTHLHFDHCGGTIEYNDTREHFQPAFPNAKFWSNDNHWKWATEPNPREKASFLSENILPIQDISYMGKTLVFMADLLPSVGHIPLPYVMGYDTRPLLTMTEKELFLNTAADNEFVLFFEHDSVNECCTLQQTDRGVRLKDAGEFTDFF
jgi:metal-dependent hydrolase (beta-lactamase superfamily II)